MDFKQLLDNVKQIHRINFQDIITIDGYDENFAFNDKYYDIENQRFRNQVISCCHRCETNNCNTVIEDGNSNSKEYKYQSYKLENVSHGSHTIDFLNASGLIENDIIQEFKTGWNDTPVLFLMENPSVNYHDMYHFCNDKYPTNAWYWIYGKKELLDNNYLDDYLKQGWYGDMVYALLKHYRLSNAYLTNIIKCGMNNKSSFENEEEAYKNEKYLGTEFYNDQCKKICITNILANEIKCLTNNSNKLKVIAFGKNSYSLAKEFFQYGGDKTISKLNIQLVQLPHPSSRLSNNYRKYIVKGFMEDLLSDDKNFLIKRPKENARCIKDIIDKFKSSGIEVSSSTALRKTQKNLVLSYKEKTSIFSDRKYITEVFIRANPDNEYICNPVKIGYGYNFIDETYWGYDYNNKEFIPVESIKTFDIFKNIIEKMVNE